MLLDWPRNLRGWALEPNGDQRPLPFFCACSKDSCYGTKINGAWSWFCSPCWQITNHWKTQQPL